MNFVFQGSQKLHIRVAISFELSLGFQCMICQIIVHFMPHWPVYSDFMGTFQLTVQGWPSHFVSKPTT